MRTILQNERASPARMSNPRRGSVLVEFGLVAFTLYLLMVVLLDLGRGTLATQTVQGAADVLAQELSRAPIDATLTFEEALATEYVKTRIYDEEHLVVRLADSGSTQEEIDTYFAALPLVNQMLRPLMFRDTIPGDQPEEVIRYPGALAKVVDGQDAYTVLIPRVLEYSDAPDTFGVETIDWIPVVEEVLPAGDVESHFPINAGSPFAGVVNVRINYPFQAAAMSAFDPNVFPNGPASVYMASDSLVQDTGLPTDYDYAIPPDFGPSAPYSGKYGLGYHYAFLQRVRPYRKIVSVQAVARREVIFGPEGP